MSTANIVPPFRAPLISDQASENGSGQVTTSRAWYLFFENLSRTVGIQGGMVNSGTHQDRLAAATADLPDGAFWVESDPPGGGVIYQVRGGRWYYVAGTKWGTFSPDQRPTDLGADDAGYQWRSTDQPPRNFLWSGTQWVEVTPIRYDTHANRLAASTSGLWQGIFWVETDRSNVIYELQGTTWKYVSGAMAGTLSPDQRPTDLGANDAGFLFMTTDTNELYRWSGTAWAKSGTQTGDVQFAQATADLVLTTTQQNVPGASIVLNRAGRYLITGNFYFGWISDGAAVLHGYLIANGVQQSPTAFFLVQVNYSYSGCAQQWVYNAPAAGQTVLLAAVKDSGGTGSSRVFSDSSITALWVSP